MREVVQTITQIGRRSWHWKVDIVYQANPEVDGNPFPTLPRLIDSGVARSRNAAEKKARRAYGDWLLSFRNESYTKRYPAPSAIWDKQ